MNTNKIVVTEIQRFCMHDGPGVRTVVFFKGCPLHCRWCHNPETQSARPQILFAKQKCIGCGGCEAVCPRHLQSVTPERRYRRDACTLCGSCVAACPTGALTAVGKEMTVDEIIREVLCDAAFYGETGGLTVSGGEPFFQWEGLLALLTAAKEKKISTCVETCGMTSPKTMQEILPYVDTFLFDLKDTDADRLRANTGGDYVTIINNLLLLDEAEKRTVLRCILIPEINLDDHHLHGIAKIFRGLKHCAYVELLPYHPYGTSKSEQLGIADPIVYPVPTQAQITDFAHALHALGVPVKCYGKMI